VRKGVGSEEEEGERVREGGGRGRRGVSSEGKGRWRGIESLSSSCTGIC
jgi:hypothetical protein